MEAARAEARAAKQEAVRLKEELGAVQGLHMFAEAQREQSVRAEGTAAQTAAEVVHRAEARAREAEAARAEAEAARAEAEAARERQVAEAVAAKEKEVARVKVLLHQSQARRI